MSEPLVREVPADLRRCVGRTLRNEGRRGQVKDPVRTVTCVKQGTLGGGRGHAALAWFVHYRTPDGTEHQVASANFRAWLKYARRVDVPGQ